MFIPLSVGLIVSRAFNVDFTGLFPFYQVYYITLNLALLFSGLLYIPVVISMQTLSHLPSVQREKPYTYILHQTFTIAAFKTIHVLAYLLKGRVGMTTATIYQFLAFLDIFSTPLTIQFSYLLSNKNNVELIERNFGVGKMYSVMFKSGQVAPTIQELTVMQTATSRF